MNASLRIDVPCFGTMERRGIGLFPGHGTHADGLDAVALSDIIELVGGAPPVGRTEKTVVHYREDGIAEVLIETDDTAWCTRAKAVLEAMPVTDRSMEASKPVGLRRTFKDGRSLKQKAADAAEDARR